jgi:OPA family glycerol-3-phosphate transporter-like MFS transporter
VEPTARQRREIFLLTWLAYGSYYLCRRPYAIAKTTLGERYHINEGDLALIETGYLVAYALGQFCSGLVADRVGARRLVGLGMLAVAATSVWFGLGSYVGVFAISYTLQGLVQATGWPGVVKAMTSMYTPENRGTVMGWWGTCYQVGGVAATALATFVLAKLGWRSAFFVPAALTGAVGVSFLLFLWEPPRTPAAERTASVAITREPLVWALGGAYFCIKLIRYCIVFWLPFFLERSLHYGKQESGYLSLSFDLGGVLGAILGGKLFDLSGRHRGWMIIAMALGLVVASIVYPGIAPLGPRFAFGGMVLVGFLLFGPDALVSSVAAQDLGGRSAAGTAAGFINGVGSVGAILQGVVTAYVSHRYGWDMMFWVFGGLAFAAAIAVIPYALAVRSGR